VEKKKKKITANG